MPFDHRDRRHKSDAPTSPSPDETATARRPFELPPGYLQYYGLTTVTGRTPVQGKMSPTPSADEETGEQAVSIHETAESGVRGGGSALPHLDPIQASFGRHDVTGVQAHTGGQAAAACEAVGAQAYAAGGS